MATNFAPRDFRSQGQELQPTSGRKRGWEKKFVKIGAQKELSADTLSLSNTAQAEW